MIKLKNISKTYKIKNQRIEALKNVSLEFANHGFIWLKGLSGSGKTTLLNLIGGIDVPDIGEIEINDVNLSLQKNHQITQYRRNEIGNIFQELYLFENMTVEENILFMQKINQELQKNLENLLNILEIKALKNHLVKELSGGEKQRVSIARALIKNPRIVLADEPSSGLDQENVHIVFSMLKEISKKTLVIVASHEETITNYADRVIEIESGSILFDEMKTSLIDIPQKIDKTERKMKFSEQKKFVKHHLFQNKKRFILSTILISFSLIFFLISLILTNFDIAKIHAKTLIKEESSYIQYEKNISDNNYRYFTPEDYTNLKEIVGEKQLQIGKIYQKNGRLLHLDFVKKPGLNFDGPAFYYSPLSFHFFKINSRTFSENYKIIGNLPKKEDEIVITEYLFEIMKKDGIIKMNEDGLEEIFYPQTMDELLNQYLNVTGGLKAVHEDAFSETKLKVVGILQQNIEKYQDLKEVTFNEIQNNAVLQDKLNEFRYKIAFWETNIYVSDEFEEFIENHTNKITSIKLSIGNTKFLSSLAVFDEEMDTQNGSVKELKDDEIIISEELNNFLIENNIIKETIQFNESLNQIENQQFKIKGVSKDGIIYLNLNNLRAHYFSPTEKALLYSIETKETKIENILHHFPINDQSVITFTGYSELIISFISTLKMLSKIFLVVSIVFFFFSFIVIIHYIENSIFTHKKEIAILKSLGTSNSEIKKIFFSEVFIINMIAVIFTILFGFFFCFVGNQIITAKLMFAFHPLNITILELLILFLVPIIIILLITQLFFWKIKKIQPHNMFQK